MQVYLGVDIGTSGSKGVVVDHGGRVLARAGRAHATAQPRPGWVEHDAEAIWWGDSTAIVRELTAELGAEQILHRAPSPPGAEPALRRWDPVARTIEPDPVALYDRFHPHYRSLYTATRETAHVLAGERRRACGRDMPAGLRTRSRLCTTTT